jgi:hypothetical protein
VLAVADADARLVEEAPDRVLLLLPLELPQAARARAASTDINRQR